MSRKRLQPAMPYKQRGAVLYVAMMMLILMALLGIIGMKVASLQEKMVSTYASDAMAFQAAESSVRDLEECLSGNCRNTKEIDQICEVSFDSVGWVKSKNFSTPAAERVKIRSIARCITGRASVAMGRAAEQGGETMPVYQIMAYATDRDSNPAADAAVDVIFMPR